MVALNTEGKIPVCELCTLLLISEFVTMMTSKWHTIMTSYFTTYLFYFQEVIFCWSIIPATDVVIKCVLLNSSYTDTGKRNDTLVHDLFLYLLGKEAEPILDLNNCVKKFNV